MLNLLEQKKDNLSIFENQSFGKIRVLERNNDIWFIAKDIADALEYSETAMMTRRLDNDEKTNLPIQQDGSNYQTNITIINESGFYNAVLGSQKPEAKVFKKWVTSEVLPSIRKTGSYHSEFYIPKTLPEALRLYAQEVESKEIAIKERDEAIKTKAWIGSKREATAMVTASIASKRVKQLEDILGEGKTYRTAKAISWVFDYFEIKPGFWSSFGKKLTALSKEKGFTMGKVQTPEYTNPINSYHVDLIEHFRLLIEEDTTILEHYRSKQDGIL